MSRFTTVAGLPADFHAGATLGLARDRAVLAGYRQAAKGWNIHDRRAWAGVYEGGAITAAYQGAGWIQAGDHAGDVVHLAGAALKASGEGSDYRLVSSTDGGRTWREAGAIPVQSLVRLLAVSEREVWAHGAGALARSVDGGAHWQDVAAPGARDPFSERLAVVGDRVLLLGAGIASTVDGGRTWQALDTAGATVHAIAGRVFIASHGAGLRLGAVKGDGVEWLVELEGGLLPYRLMGEGQKLRFLARPADPARTTPGALVWSSDDVGKEWSQLALPCLPGEEHSDLAPGDGWFALDGQRRLLLPG